MEEPRATLMMALRINEIKSTVSNMDRFWREYHIGF